VLKIGIKIIFGLFFRIIGITSFIRNINAKKKATILVYHNPDVHFMESHLRYLSRRFIFTSLDILIDAVYKKDWSAVPRKALIITFDDGHKGNFKLLEILQRYKIKSTVYNCTGIVNTNRHFWWTLKGLDYQSLKELGELERLNYLKKQGFAPTKEYPEQDRQALDINEMTSMKDTFEFESHSRFHPILATCEDEECRKEIIDSKKELEKLFLIKRSKAILVENTIYRSYGGEIPIWRSDTI